MSRIVINRKEKREIGKKYFNSISSRGYRLGYILFDRYIKYRHYIIGWQTPYFILMNMKFDTAGLLNPRGTETNVSATEVNLRGILKFTPYIRQYNFIYAITPSRGYLVWCILFFLFFSIPFCFLFFFLSPIRYIIYRILSKLSAITQTHPTAASGFVFQQNNK